MRELDDRNSEDSKIKAKIREHCQCPRSVPITHTATNDLGLVPLTKDAVLEALKEHIEFKRRVFTDVMDNGDVAYIVKECAVQESILYVKVKFFERQGKEAMLIVSAHPPRRWC